MNGNITRNQTNEILEEPLSDDYYNFSLLVPAEEALLSVHAADYYHR